MAVTAKITSILEGVRDQEQAQEALWQRMDRDNMRWRGDAFRPNPEEGIEQGDVYTSNDLRTMADKAVAVLAESDVLHRVISDHEDAESRDADNNAERLSIGFLTMGDKRLKASGVPGFQAQLAWYSIVRGGHINARALLRKDAAGETIVDLTPYDPRHVVVVSDENGPIWAAIINRRSRGKIQKQYPKFLSFDADASDSDQYQVLDYWERVVVKRAKEDKTDESGEALAPKYQWHNGVIIDSRWAKRLHNTFTEEPNPIFRSNGYNPGVGNYSFQEPGGVTREMVGIADWSESIFAANRGVIDAKSRILTWALALSAKAVQSIYTLKSRGGTSELDDSPNERGQVIPLDTEKDEEIALLEIAQTGQDVNKLLAVVTQEALRGGLLDPSEIAGSNPSGRALRIMSQILREKLAPHERAVKDVIEAASAALLAQYATGRYKPIRAVGISRDLEGFNREITSEDISGHGPVTIELVPVLPEDDFERIQMAALAAQPGADGMALIPRRSRDTRILRVQDANLEMRRGFADKARMLTPMTTLVTLLEAAQERGDEATVAFLLDELVTLNRERQMEQFAREQAFAGMLDQSAMNTTAAGVSPSPNGQPPAGAGSPRSPLGGMAPESAPLSGQPIAGENTGAGRPPAPGGSDFEQQLFNTTGLVIAR